MSFVPKRENDDDNDSQSFFKNILTGGLLGAMTNGKFMYPGLALMMGKNPLDIFNGDNERDGWDGRPRGLGRHGWGQQMGQQMPPMGPQPYQPRMQMDFNPAADQQNYQNWLQNGMRNGRMM